MKSEQTDDTGVYISEIHEGDYIKVREVDFGNESPDAFAISAACSSLGGSLEVHLDKEDGELIAKLDVTKTGGWEKWKTFSAQMLKKVTGKHDIYFVFKGLKEANSSISTGGSLRRISPILWFGLMCLMWM